MCGIVGVVTGQNNLYDIPEIVNKMASKIVHRGPDFSGLHFDENLSFCFAHQRLSILDLSKNGNQPMESFNKRYVIAFNGEIYNFEKIRRKLNLVTNIQWRSQSDTEVLINAITFWGIEKTLNLSQGMFSIALLDKKLKKLFLARDRFGEKPMYWGFTGFGSSKALVFGSEISAIQEFPLFNKDINKKAIDSLMRFSCIPSDLTIYNSIKKLKPGHLAEFDLENSQEINPPRIYKWWDYKNTIQKSDKLQFKDEKDALLHLEKILIESAKACSVSDVPIGCFLSGGVDSSLIASLLTNNVNSKLNTFTIGFEDKSYDESIDAKKIANFLGTNHEEIILKPYEAMEIIPNLPSIYSEPFADQSQIPTALICREIKKKGIDVALTGDGGDEIFGGYVRHFRGSYIWSKLELMPFKIRSKLGKLIKSIPQEKISRFDLFNTKNNIQQKLYRTATRLENLKSCDDLYRSLLIENIDKSIYSKSFINEFNEPFNKYYSELNDFPICKENDPISRMLYWDAVSYLPDDILVKVDRASMAYSLETRAPFLDNKVVEMAWRIPTSMKVKNGQGKLILKKLLCKYLPKEFVYKPKKGFGVPVEEWLRGPLKEWAEDHLLGNNLKDQDYFEVDKIKEIWYDHLYKKIDNTRIIWPILMLQSWLEFNK